MQIQQHYLCHTDTVYNQINHMDVLSPGSKRRNDCSSELWRNLQGSILLGKAWFEKFGISEEMFTSNKR